MSSCNYSLENTAHAQIVSQKRRKSNLFRPYTAPKNSPQFDGSFRSKSKEAGRSLEAHKVRCSFRPLTAPTGFATSREIGSRQSICFPQNWQNSPSFPPNCFPQCGHLLKIRCGIRQEIVTMTPTISKGS